MKKKLGGFPLIVAIFYKFDCTIQTAGKSKFPKNVLSKFCHTLYPIFYILFM